MVQEPGNKRTVAFFDGQNLFHQAQDAFGYTYPNFCPLALASRVCKAKEFSLQEIRFYTGIPAASKDSYWHHFWTTKLMVMSRMGIKTYSRELRYRQKTIVIGDGVEYSAEMPEEKGIDVRIAIDIMRLTRTRSLDVALVFSQDQDFSEVADEVRRVADEQQRWIKIVSAYPVSLSARNKRGINKTDWFKIQRDFYDNCIDHRDYRPKRSSSSNRA